MAYKSATRMLLLASAPCAAYADGGDGPGFTIPYDECAVDLQMSDEDCTDQNHGHVSIDPEPKDSDVCCIGECSSGFAGRRRTDANPCPTGTVTDVINGHYPDVIDGQYATGCCMTCESFKREFDSGSVPGVRDGCPPVMCKWQNGKCGKANFWFGDADSNDPCPDGYRAMTMDECLTAAVSGLSEKDLFDGTVSESALPSGCLKRVSTGIFAYNTHPVGAADSDLKKICIEVNAAPYCKDSSKSCQSWAEEGKCSNLPWMSYECANSCKTCTLCRTNTINEPGNQWDSWCQANCADATEGSTTCNHAACSYYCDSGCACNQECHNFFTADGCPSPGCAWDGGSCKRQCMPKRYHKKWDEKTCQRRCNKNSCHRNCARYCNHGCGCSTAKACEDDDTYATAMPGKYAGKDCAWIASLTSKKRKKMCKKFQGTVRKGGNDHKIKAAHACQATCGKCFRKADVV